MADNVVFTGSVATYTAAADEASYLGATAKIQVAHVLKVTGAAGSRVLGGLTYHKVSAGSGDAQNISTATGEIHSIIAFNKGIYTAYAKLHLTAGTPTPGASVWRTIAIPSGIPRDITFYGGLTFTTGLGITIVQDLADSGTTAVVAGDVVFDLEYTKNA